MYLSAPRWRGTSPVNRLRSAGQVRGLGDLPPCSSIAVPPGFVGPVECDPASGGVRYAASQSQVADLQSQIDALALAESPDAPSFSDWLNENATTLKWVGGSVAALILLQKVVRR